MHLAAQKLIGGDAAQNYVRVGHGGALAFAIAGWSGIGADRLRSHAQQSAFIHSRERSTAGAYGVNVEHRNANGEAIDGRLGTEPRTAVGEAHIGGSAAHVEAQDARKAAGSGDGGGAHHSSGRT